jgi:hypothetical protein
MDFGPHLLLDTSNIHVAYVCIKLLYKEKKEKAFLRKTIQDCFLLNNLLPVLCVDDMVEHHS